MVCVGQLVSTHTQQCLTIEGESQGLRLFRLPRGVVVSVKKYLNE